MSNATYLETVEARWDTLREAAGKLGVRGLEQSTPSGWTAKEMLAHVAFWHEAAPYVIEHMLRGKPDPASWLFPSGYDPFASDEDWPSDAVHNAREAAWARGQTPAAVLDRLDRAHAGLVEVLATLTEDELTTHAAYLTEVHAHLVEHANELASMSASGTGGAG